MLPGGKGSFTTIRPSSLGPNSSKLFPSDGITLTGLKVEKQSVSNLKIHKKILTIIANERHSSSIIRSMQILSKTQTGGRNSRASFRLPPMIQGWDSKRGFDPLLGFQIAVLAGQKD
jgi:hypothetical protein